MCGMLQARRKGNISRAPYIGLYTTEEYNRAHEQATKKEQTIYTPLERVLFVDDNAQLYDLFVRICQLDW